MARPDLAEPAQRAHQSATRRPATRRLAPGDGPDRDAVAQVADTIVHLTRAFGRARDRMIAAAEHDVEWSAHVLLKHLDHEGPLRSGAVAEMLGFDPSTVSRQVAGLVRDGLLERRADPNDGRASLLVLTDKAHAVLAEHNRIRLDYFAGVVADWTDDELRDFGAKLSKFDAAYEASSNEWLRERIAARDARPRSTT